MVSLVDRQEAGLQMGCQHWDPFLLGFGKRGRQRKIKGFTQKSCSAIMTVESFAAVGAMGLYQLSARGLSNLL